MISANGGIGGLTLAATNFGAVAGSSGGSGGTGGEVRIAGGNGVYAFTNPGGSIGWSGTGGAGLYGIAGEGIVSNQVSMTGVQAPGVSGALYGGGASGGINGPSATAQVGGLGGPGLVIITEFIT